METAFYIMSEVEKNKKSKRRNLNADVCAVVFIACRKREKPQTIKDIVALTGASKKDVSKAYSKIKVLIPDIGGNKTASLYAQ